jgi:molybdate transport system substrate-binding protein
MRWLFAAACALALGGCKKNEAPSVPEPLKVAAAADLARAFPEIATAFEKESGQKITFTFGSTGLLSKQIIEGAPYDVFAAANVSYVDEVLKTGTCAADTKAMYARGRIGIWMRNESTVPPPKTLKDLADPRFVRIAIANPAHAPYGKAAQQALEKVGIWDQIKPRLVYGENIQQTLQFAQSGNVEAAIVALSLATVAGGSFVDIDPALHAPIDQALVVCSRDPARAAVARRFAAYVNSPTGRAIMRRYGFLLPGETVTPKVQ